MGSRFRGAGEEEDGCFANKESMIELEAAGEGVAVLPEDDEEEAEEADSAACGSTEGTEGTLLDRERLKLSLPSLASVSAAAVPAADVLVEAVAELLIVLDPSAVAEEEAATVSELGTEAEAEVGAYVAARARVVGEGVGLPSGAAGEAEEADVEEEEEVKVARAVLRECVPREDRREDASGVSAPSASMMDRFSRSTSVEEEEEEA